ncbi:MAG: DUF456 domain-containing protein [Tannerella sp.]|jgi:uncharacterized protein YqgC (DUF456 family)|nr:DUF456 domain-containing protein [Tannerella sp.]
MVSEILLIALGAVCLITGLLGSIIPALPGPPLSYAGLLLLHFTERVQFTTTQLVLWLLLVTLTILADYMLPVLGVKKWNGSKWGNIGCIAGMIAGIFIIPPWGLIIGPFLGAVLGELLFAGKKAPEAFKAGFGAFLGFILGMIFKLSVCGWFIFCFIKALIAGPDSP